MLKKSYSNAYDWRQNYDCLAVNVVLFSSCYTYFSAVGGRMRLCARVFSCCNNARFVSCADIRPGADTSPMYLDKIQIHWKCHRYMNFKCI